MELPERVLSVRARVPTFATPPPLSCPPRKSSPRSDGGSCSVRFPLPSTKKMRKSAPHRRVLIVLPFPSMVIWLSITGRPVGPKKLVLASISVCVLLLGSTMVSAPPRAPDNTHPPVFVSGSAAVMASTSSAGAVHDVDRCRHRGPCTECHEQRHPGQRPLPLAPQRPPHPPG